MFEFIKQVLIMLLSSSGLLVTKCISLNNEPFIAKTTLLNLNPNELHHASSFYG